MRSIQFIIAGLGLAVFLLLQCVFVVDQTERAILLQLGKPVGNSDYGPGLHFKLPFVQNVIFFDSRVLEYDAPAAEILTQDKKNMVVDNFSRWKIVNPLMFYRTVRNVQGGLSRIDDIVYSQMREALGRYTLTEIVAVERSTIMDEVTTKSNVLLGEYGIYIIDVRIKRTDLPQENQMAIYGRMQAERERQAKQYRSEGREEATKITTMADRQRTVLLADALRAAESARGEGEAAATAIYAVALSQDPDFYEFVRTMDAYKKTMKDQTQFVLTPQSEFFKYLQ
ncbi:MAG: protease modulator HflC [Desulfomicrobium sp.]|nr:protease modulator HflC [Pseudomonadota bacterium]MBV1711697.1 protease modulator HflC [Desulfomicrobium sp.]MBU4569761.1 protease modulator HflC [Pseudomonadota bacterium]MBU4595481.1 protease modulator HflC [Pseudomonadota bacterium]MBV1721807.1 protease modulator HflC [Desulfomicrobium sp.]